MRGLCRRRQGNGRRGHLETPHGTKLPSLSHGFVGKIPRPPLGGRGSEAKHKFAYLRSASDETRQNKSCFLVDFTFFRRKLFPFGWVGEWLAGFVQGLKSQGGRGGGVPTSKSCGKRFFQRLWRHCLVCFMDSFWRTKFRALGAQNCPASVGNPPPTAGTA